MKKFIVPVLMLLVFAACTKKSNVAPTKPIVIAPIYDTIPDGALFTMYLVKDSTYHNSTSYDFCHKCSLDYIDTDEDWPYFNSTDPAQLWTITPNNFEVLEDYVPYSRGVSFKMHVDCDQNIPIFLRLIYIHNMPPTIHIWCKDNYLKDSVDLTHGAHINFSIDHTIPASSSDDRFQVVLWSDKKN